MLLLLGIICVVTGFCINIFGMRQIKNNDSLRFGIINEIRKENGGYLLKVSYSPLKNDKTVEASIWTKKKPNSTQLVVTEKNDEVIIYNGKKKALYSSFGFWVIGALLCLLA